MSKGKGGSQPSGFTPTVASQSPWVNQQPYLQQTFADAQNLYQNYRPTYYPGPTTAPLNSFQTAGINNLATVGDQLNTWRGDPLDFSHSLLRGDYLNNDESLRTLNAVASGRNAGLDSPGEGALESYASGGQTNPFLDQLAQSTLASVVPSIQKQFIEGGGLSSPQAAFATSQGASAALAPVLSNAFQQEQQNQLNAAGQLATNYLAGQGQKISGAAAAGNQYGNDLQRMVQGLALAPQTLQAQLLGPQAQLQAGNLWQGADQQNINDALQRWNFNQTLPYQLLNEYIGQVSGNYGGLSQSLNPYYTNTGANALGGGLGGALVGSQLLGPAGLGLVSSGAGAGIGGGLGLLLGLV